MLRSQLEIQNSCDAKADLFKLTKNKNRKIYRMTFVSPFVKFEKDSFPEFQPEICNNIFNEYH